MMCFNLLKGEGMFQFAFCFSFAFFGAKSLNFPSQFCGMICFHCIFKQQFSAGVSGMSSGIPHPCHGMPKMYQNLIEILLIEH